MESGLRRLWVFKLRRLLRLPAVHICHILEEQKFQSELSLPKASSQFLNEWRFHLFPQNTPWHLVHLVCTDCTLTRKHWIQTNIQSKLSTVWKECVDIPFRLTTSHWLYWHNTLCSGSETDSTMTQTYINLSCSPSLPPLCYLTHCQVILILFWLWYKDQTNYFSYPEALWSVLL